MRKDTEHILFFTHKKTVSTCMYMYIFLSMKQKLLYAKFAIMAENVANIDWLGKDRALHTTIFCYEPPYLVVCPLSVSTK